MWARFGHFGDAEIRAGLSSVRLLASIVSELVGLQRNNHANEKC